MRLLGLPVVPRYRTAARVTEVSRRAHIPKMSSLCHGHLTYARSVHRDTSLGKLCWRVSVPWPETESITFSRARASGVACGLTGAGHVVGIGAIATWIGAEFTTTGGCAVPCGDALDVPARTPPATNRTRTRPCIMSSLPNFTRNYSRLYECIIANLIVDKRGEASTRRSLAAWSLSNRFDPFLLCDRQRGNFAVPSGGMGRRMHRNSRAADNGRYSYQRVC